MKKVIAATGERDARTTVAESGARSGHAGARTCHNYWCNFTTVEALTRCPKCGRPLLSVQVFRLLGLALVFIGGVLAAAGALLLILVAPRLIGGTGVKLLIWGLFGMLLAVGLSFMTAGVLQVIFGKRSQQLMTYVIVLLIALSLIAVIARAVL
jgi:hypothetical protein